MKTRKPWLYCLVATAVCLVGNAALADSGTLDTSFNQKGYELVRFPERPFYAGTLIQQQNDGKWLVAGPISSKVNEVNFAVSRFLPDGRIDRSYAQDGIVKINMPALADYPSGWVSSIVSRKNGGVLAFGGRTAFTKNSAQQCDGAVFVLNANGSLDSRFNGEGIIRFAKSSDCTTPNDIAEYPDGAFLLLYSNIGKLERRLANGELDKTFGVDGVVAFSPVPGAADFVTLMPDGKIVLSYQLNTPTYPAEIKRLQADGTLDKSFGTEGVLTLDDRSFIRQLFAKPDGSLNIFVENANAGDVVMHITAAGTIDTAFGNAGVVVATMPYKNFTESGGKTVLPQRDGSWLYTNMIGGLSGGWGSTTVIQRFLSDGTLDNSFGNVGVLIFDNSTVQMSDNSVKSIYSLAHTQRFQHDGKLMLSGGYGDLALARLTLDRDNDGIQDGVDVFDGPFFSYVAGNKAGALTGAAIASADLDNDGYADVVVGSPGDGAGSVTVYSGKDHSVLYGPYYGAHKGDRFGAAVAIAPDQDGDGKADLVIGAPGASFNGEKDTGTVAVYSLASGAQIGETLVAGKRPHNHVGSAVAVGDTTGTGVQDLVVGSPDFDLPVTEGKRKRLRNLGVVNVFNGISSTLRYVRAGTQVNERFGAAVAVDSDHRLLVGAPNHAIANPAGKPALLAAAGQLQAFDSRNGKDAALLTLNGTFADQQLGSAVATANADLDGDGQQDWLLGSAGSSAHSGRVAIYSSVANKPWYSEEGQTGGALMGAGLAVGDINADGKPDLIIGAPMIGSQQVIGDKTLILKNAGEVSVRSGSLLH